MLCGGGGQHIILFGKITTYSFLKSPQLKNNVLQLKDLTIFVLSQIMNK